MASIVAFPGPADRTHLTAAVDRYLDSIQTTTTRASYAETLARLADVTGADRPVGVLGGLGVEPAHVKEELEEWIAPVQRRHRRLGLMTSLAQAPHVLGWGEPAVAQAAIAARVAKQVWGLPVGSPEPTGYVD